MRGLMAVALASMLVGCGYSEEDAIRAAEDSVREAMMDPESARIEGSFFVESGKTDEGYTSGSVCGWVNGKNAFGAYIGKRRFVVQAVYGKEGAGASAHVNIEDGSARPAWGKNETLFELI